MADQAILFRTDDGFASNFVPLPRSTGVATGGSIGNLFGILLPAILLASIISGLTTLGSVGSPAAVPPPATVAPPACPVCTTAVPCTTLAPCMPMPSCPTGFIKLSNGGIEIPDKCYAIITQNVKFIEAMQQCGLKGAFLANPMTEVEGLALKTYLTNNFPFAFFYFGYTDMGNADNIMLALLGGETSPIPGLNVNAGVPDGNSASDTSCTIIFTGNKNDVFPYNFDCTDSYKAVCEINLKNQNCICP